MPKISDFSKFDLQSIVNSVKSIINPEPVTPNVAEGDPIGAKIVKISTLLQGVTKAQSQSAKDLSEINSLLNDLYKDLEAFRKLEAELKQKQHAETVSVHATDTSSHVAGTPSGSGNTGAPSANTTTTGAKETLHPSSKTTESLHPESHHTKHETHKPKDHDEK